MEHLTCDVFKAKSDFVSRSVLSPLLPEAAILYLEEYGAEKFAQTFLGEFDNPEVIWNNDMRCAYFVESWNAVWEDFFQFSMVFQPLFHIFRLLHRKQGKYIDIKNCNLHSSLSMTESNLAVSKISSMKFYLSKFSSGGL